MAWVPTIRFVWTEFGRAMKKIFDPVSAAGSDAVTAATPVLVQPASFASISLRTSAIEMSPATAIPA